MRKRKLLLLFLFALAVLATQAQVVTQPVRPWHFYRGNPSTVQTIVLPASDSLSVASAVLLNYTRTQIMPSYEQPTVNQVGTQVDVYWTSTSPLPELSYVQVKANGVTRFASFVKTDNNTQNLTPPTSWTTSGSGTTAPTAISEFLALLQSIANQSLDTIAQFFNQLYSIY